MINENKYFESTVDKFQENCKDKSKEKQARDRLTKPQWIRKVEIDADEIENDVNLLLAEKCAEEWEDLIQCFLNKIKIDIKDRESFNLVRRQPTFTDNPESIPNSYLNTITRFQEFFGLDANCEPINGTTNPFEFGLSPEELEQRRLEDEDSSPHVKKSVVMCFEDVDDEFL